MPTMTRASAPVKRPALIGQPGAPRRCRRRTRVIVDPSAADTGRASPPSVGEMPVAA